MKNTFIALVGALVLTAGCATKKFVRTTVDPVSAKLSEVDQRTAENAAAITGLDAKTARGISRADERAGAADARAAEADRKAVQAGERAALAMERAHGAHSLAEGGLARTGKLEVVVENLDNFRVTSTRTLYFDFDKAALKDDDLQQIDELVGSLNGARRFVIEVQGFTDATGATDYNYELGARRAASVVRYLATHHQVPSYRIHTLSLGKDQPVEANKTKEGRKLNRRVEIRAYLPQPMQELAQQTTTP